MEMLGCNWGARMGWGCWGGLGLVPLAVLGVAEAAALAVQAVEAGQAVPLLTAAALEAGLAQAAPIHVEALAPVGTVTALLAVLPVPPHWALLLAPAWGAEVVTQPHRELRWLLGSPLAPS